MPTFTTTVRTANGAIWMQASYPTLHSAETLLNRAKLQIGGAAPAGRYDFSIIGPDGTETHQSSLVVVADAA